jgi:hypothetical protein
LKTINLLAILAVIAVIIATLIVALAVSSDDAEGSQDKVVLCHYDRNDSGPTAGPHTIEVAAPAVEYHLTNHTQAEGYAGNDSLGACPEEVTPSPEPTQPPTPESTPTFSPRPTRHPKPSPTVAPPTPTPVISATSAAPIPEAPAALPNTGGRK